MSVLMVDFCCLASVRSLTTQESDVSQRSVLKLPQMRIIVLPRLVESSKITTQPSMVSNVNDLLLSASLSSIFRSKVQTRALPRVPLNISFLRVYISVCFTVPPTILSIVGAPPRRLSLSSYCFQFVSGSRKAFSASLAIICQSALSRTATFSRKQMRDRTFLKSVQLLSSKSF